MKRLLIALGALFVLLVGELTAPAAQADAAALQLSGYEVVGATNVPVAAGSTGATGVDCPADKRPLGGGVYAGDDGMRLIETFPLGAPFSPAGWTGTVFNGGGASTFDVYAICSPVPTD
jgi:hypothetical protein